MVRTKEERRNLVEQYKSSGQTQRAFAENNGVKLKTFWSLRKGTCGLLAVIENKMQRSARLTAKQLKTGRNFYRGILKLHRSSHRANGLLIKMKSIRY
ncbi:hypothetical protein [Treponema sp.]|uniref:hypothetical protein n=1 Tax=Treponema sp. TaxID=166 RepID=UPI003FD72379